jgi:hypothetical protein
VTRDVPSSRLLIALQEVCNAYRLLARPLLLLLDLLFELLFELLLADFPLLRCWLDLLAPPFEAFAADDGCLATVPREALT